MCRENEALHFHFDLRMSYYEDHFDYHQRRALHLLYSLKPKHTYITVFGSIQSEFIRPSAVHNWKHEITHDSCWSDIRVFSEVYFAMAKQINADMVKDGLPEVAPIKMSESNGPSLFYPLYDWVKVNIQADPNDDNRYRKIVTVF